MKFNKKIFLSIAFFLIYITSFLAMELDWLETDMVEVVMSKKDIKANTIIDDNNVYIGEVKREYFTESMVTDPVTVLGKRATEDIAKNTKMRNSYLDAAMLRPSKDHEFFPIPSSWLLTIQGTLRRYDQVNVTAVYTDYGLDEEEEIETPIKGKFVLEDIPVAYVKSNKNKEVTGVNANQNRLNGQYNPEELELSMTLDQYKKLESLVSDGYKFVLSY